MEGRFGHDMGEPFGRRNQSSVMNGLCEPSRPTSIIGAILFELLERVKVIFRISHRAFERSGVDV